MELSTEEQRLQIIHATAYSDLLLARKLATIISSDLERVKIFCELFKTHREIEVILIGKSTALRMARLKDPNSRQALEVTNTTWQDRQLEAFDRSFPQCIPDRRFELIQEQADANLPLALAMIELIESDKERLIAYCNISQMIYNKGDRDKSREIFERESLIAIRKRKSLVSFGPETERIVRNTISLIYPKSHLRKILDREELCIDSQDQFLDYIHEDVRHFGRIGDAVHYALQQDEQRLDAWEANPNSAPPRVEQYHFEEI